MPEAGLSSCMVGWTENGGVLFECTQESFCTDAWLIGHYCSVASGFASRQLTCVSPGRLGLEAKKEENLADWYSQVSLMDSCSLIKMLSTSSQRPE